LAKLGRDEEAEMLLVSVMENRKRVLGPSDFSTLASMTNVVKLYLYQKRLEEAERLSAQYIKAMKTSIREKYHQEALEGYLAAFEAARERILAGEDVPRD
jgi:hypothetical protein